MFSRGACIPAVNFKKLNMETNLSLIEPLLDRAEQYSKTSIELIKLRLVDKTAELSSTLLSRLLFVLAIAFFTLAINIAIALWLGDLFGKNYFGFLIVALFYGIAGIILWYAHPRIKASVNDSIIVQMLN